MPDLLSLIVKRWKTGFKGVSASEVAGVLGISHDDALSQLRAIAAKGLIVVREYQDSEPVKFNDVKTGSVTIRIVEESRSRASLMAFPSNPVLAEVFYTDRIDYGVFTNRLHMGASQVQHYYFKRDVLDKYMKHRDRYAVREDATGGGVSMTTEYFMSIPETDTFASVRFGKMNLADGTEAIGAIAKDLDYLPKSEQHHWAAHEIESPVLSKDDKSWADYISESFEANWDADHTDYIKVLSELLDELNKRHGQIFSKTSHPGLHVPVLNTHGEYIAAHKELYKLVGADNLVDEILKTLLRSAGCQEKDFEHDSGRPKGKWALMKLLADRRGLDWAPFEAVATNRQDDSHGIRERAPSGDYYPVRFREDLKKLIVELQKLL